MAYFRNRGNSITLLHGFREDLGVRQKRLKTFSGPDALRAALEPKAWARLQIEVEQRHPECALDWAELREQAEKLLDQLSPNAAETWEDRLDAVGRPARALCRALQRLHEGEATQVREAIGPKLADVVAFFFAGDRHMEGLMQYYLPNAEAADGKVDEAIYAFQHNNTTRGRKMFQAAHTLNPFDPDVVNSEGICWFDRGALEEAERCFLAARAMAYNQLPNRLRSYSWSDMRVRPYIRATYNLALLRERQERYQEAFDGMQECLQRCPNDGIGSRFHLGTLLLQLGRLEESLPHFRDALSGNLVNLPDPYFDGAITLFRLERVEEAISWLLQGSAINPYMLAAVVSPPKRAQSEQGVDSKGWAQKYAQSSQPYWHSAERALAGYLAAHPRVKPLLRKLMGVHADLGNRDPQADLDRDELHHLEKALEDELRDARLTREVYLAFGSGQPSAPTRGTKRTGPRSASR